MTDLLPALISDSYLIMADAVLDAARGLPWTEPSAKMRLAVHALTVVDNVDVAHHLEIHVRPGSVSLHVGDTQAVAAMERRALAR